MLHLGMIRTGVDVANEGLPGFGAFGESHAEIAFADADDRRVHIEILVADAHMTSDAARRLTHQAHP